MRTIEPTSGCSILEVYCYSLSILNLRSAARRLLVAGVVKARASQWVSTGAKQQVGNEALSPKDCKVSTYVLEQHASVLQELTAAHPLFQLCILPPFHLFAMSIPA